MLQMRQIPGSDITVSSMALGTADWTSRKGEDPDRLYATYRAAGGNCLDGAHCYAFWLDACGEPEQILGRLVRQNGDRKNVVLCTKGCHITGGEKYKRPERYMTPALLASDIRDSLQRLATDYIDIYYLHRDDPAVPVDEILDALHEHQRAGRIRHYAASNWQPARLEQAADYCRRKGIPPFIASQVLFNLGHLAKPLSPDLSAINDAQEHWYENHPIPVFAYSATANGYFANSRPNFASYDDPISAGRRERASEMASKLGASPTQVALAYLMHLPFMVIPITGTTRVEHLQDNLKAADLRLSPEQVRWLRHGATAPGTSAARL